MPDIGTYTSSDFPAFPFKTLPEPGDMITFDWMDSVAKFQQRYIRIATQIATVTDLSNFTFDYSSLRCDYFPPYIKVYVFDPEESQWEIWNPYSDPSTPPTNGFRFVITEVGLGSCKITNYLNRTRVFLAQAYL